MKETNTETNNNNNNNNLYSSSSVYEIEDKPTQNNYSNNYNNYSNELVNTPTKSFMSFQDLRSEIN